VGRSLEILTLAKSVSFFLSFDSDLTRMDYRLACPAHPRLAGRNTVGLEFWDTQGHLAFAEVSASAFTKTDVDLMCFEHNEEDETEEEETINNWIDKVKNRAPKCTTILVLTKADLLKPAVVDDLKMTRDEFAKQYGAKFLAITSAKNDWDVTSLLMHIADCPKAPTPESVVIGGNGCGGDGGGSSPVLGDCQWVLNDVLLIIFVESLIR
jgi:hypothetical protein